jgi:hypothetical protein
MIVCGMWQRMPASLLEINPERDGRSHWKMDKKLPGVALP